MPIHGYIIYTLIDKYKRIDKFKSKWVDYSELIN